MASSRVQRGRQSEQLVADYLAQHGFPHAERVAASLKGADVTGTPGIAVEVKSRTRLELGEWMKQAAKRDGLPLLVVRLNGQGPAAIEDWPAILPFGLLVELLRNAGYGTPQEDCGNC